MDDQKKSKPTLRARADKVRNLRCKNLIAVIEDPKDLRNIGTIIRNVNALGAEKTYVVTNKPGLPEDWRDMRTKAKLSAVSASAIKWSFVKKLARQQNLWVNSGSGNAPSAWYKAISAPW